MAGSHVSENLVGSFTYDPIFATKSYSQNHPPDQYTSYTFDSGTASIYAYWELTAVIQQDLHSAIVMNDLSPVQGLYLDRLLLNSIEQSGYSIAIRLDSFLQDFSPLLLSSSELPITAPNLSDPSLNEATIRLNLPFDYYADATFTSLTLRGSTDIPEPNTLALVVVALGCLGIISKRALPSRIL